MTYDLVLILGGGISESGELRPSSLARVKLALSYFSFGEISKFLVCGKYPYGLAFAPKCSEASAMKALLVKNGVAQDSIFLEEESMDTIGNAWFAKQLVVQKNLGSNLLIITSDFHIPRVDYVFTKIFGPKYKTKVVGVKNPAMLRDSEREEKWMKYMKTIFNPIEAGDDFVLKDVIFSKHPLYASSPEKTMEEVLEEIGIA